MTRRKLTDEEMEASRREWLASLTPRERFTIFVWPVLEWLLGLLALWITWRAWRR